MAAYASFGLPTPVWGRNEGTATEGVSPTAAAAPSSAAVPPVRTVRDAFRRRGALGPIGDAAGSTVSRARVAEMERRIAALEAERLEYRSERDGLIERLEIARLAVEEAAEDAGEEEEARRARVRWG